MWSCGQPPHGQHHLSRFSRPRIDKRETITHFSAHLTPASKRYVSFMPAGRFTSAQYVKHYENQILPALSNRCMSACTRQINHGAVVRQILYCTVEKLAVPHVTVGTAAERSRWLPLLQNSPSFSSESMDTVVSAKVIACIPTVPPIAEHHSNSFVVHILMLTYCTYILANPK